jgi:pimeloyl-ACP methyl ester carboxylesterase
MCPRVPHLVRKSTLVCLAFAVSTLVTLVFIAARAYAKSTPRAPHAAAIASAHEDARVRGKYPVAPATLDGDLLVYPPYPPAREAKATVVYLHGIHGLAVNGCPWMRSDAGWTVCPEANERLANGTFSWAGSAADKRAIVARAERAAGSGDGETVLVGFSQGAYVVVELLEARLGRYRGVVFLSADVAPTARELRAAGVSRVVLGAGELDGAYAPMRATAERLGRDGRDGLDVRFVSLGRVGHTYAADDRAALANAIAWAAGA